jgi:hypothetical protein
MSRGDGLLDEAVRVCVMPASSVTFWKTGACENTTGATINVAPASAANIKRRRARVTMTTAGDVAR